MGLTELDAAIRTVCPIDGVSIGRRDDKATWRIDFKDEATSEQRAAAKAILAGVSSIDPPAEPKSLVDQLLADPLAVEKLKKALA